MSEEWYAGTGHRPDSVHVGNVTEMDGTRSVAVAFLVDDDETTYVIRPKHAAQIGAAIIEHGALANEGPTYDR